MPDRAAELHQVSSGLAEVVADDLVTLDGVPPCSSSQSAKPMKVGTDHLGKRLVGRIADQEVTETNASSLGSEPLSGRISSLRTSEPQLLAHLRPRQRFHGP